MSISGVGSPGSPPVDVRQRTTSEPTETKQPISAAPGEAAAPLPGKPLDQISGEIKNALLQTQETANDPGAASNETLTQLFRTLVDLLAKSPAPSTKLDV
ncbi:MAG: hypothetical protein JWM77_2001 [Rhodospirillales bacterium]|nr:hypothetical protein [Rhodospirillales bacterium]